MLKLVPELRGRRTLRLLCIGAHSDDLEIGCGGTVMSLTGGPRAVAVDWVVLSAVGERRLEARRSARALLRRATEAKIELHDFRDGFFNSDYARLKTFFETLKSRPAPDIVLTHRLEDRHQDHRLTSELTWNTFRDHLILEYEIPKYEGDLGQPNVYMPLTRRVADRKATHLQKYFQTQRSKHWFEPGNFLALARLRGLESRSVEGFAEAFHSRKLVLGVPS